MPLTRPATPPSLRSSLRSGDLEHERPAADREVTDILRRVAERQVRLFKNGRNQALRIPRDLELPGHEAILRKEGPRLIVEPVAGPSLLAELATLKPLDEEFPPIPRPVAEPRALTWRGCTCSIRTSSRTLFGSRRGTIGPLKAVSRPGPGINRSPVIAPRGRRLPSAKIVKLHTVAQHVVHVGQHRRRDRENRLLGTATAFEPEKLGVKIAVLLASGGPRLEIALAVCDSVLQISIRLSK